MQYVTLTVVSRVDLSYFALSRSVLCIADPLVDIIPPMSEEFPAPNDTDAVTERIKYERLRAMTLEERLERFFELCSAARVFVAAGIRHRHPGCSDEQLQKRFAAVVLGREFSLARYGWDPEVEGY